jgi:hypothetical protein
MFKYPEKYRIAGVAGVTDGGAFKIPYQARDFYIVASHGGGWDHVSVSLENRCPSWKEISYIKKLFWDDEDCVVQFHPPQSRYKNLHPYCLHLWKPQFTELPMPPVEFV